MRICVYSGSNLGGPSAYQRAANSLGTVLGRAGITLVYGGTVSGLMGILADAALSQGGRVIGVITHFLENKGLAHTGLNELHRVQSMHQRKALMAKLADAYIALPGGIGTLEEIFEVWTWAQLGFHEKPCGLFNVNGYYDKLLAFLDHTVSQQFMRPEHRQMLLVENTAQDLLLAMRNYHAPHVSKWLDGQTQDQPSVPDSE